MTATPVQATPVEAGAVQAGPVQAGPGQGPAWSLPHRVARLAGGQLLFSVAIALLVRSGLGAMPWDVLHQGIARHLHLSMGTVTLGVGGLLLLAWVPLGIRPGVGTLLDLALVAVGLDGVLALLPAASSEPVALAYVGAGLALDALATAVYVGAGLGAGPRDGLVLGLAARTGTSVRLLRWTTDAGAVLAGMCLGGTAGVATLAYALLSGPLVHVLLPRLAMPRRAMA